MADLTSTFDDLANWGDVAIVPTPDEDDPNPIYIDPRPTPLEIITIDAQIASLTAKLSEISVLRAQLLASRALITCIPPELLSRIFELAVHVTPSLLSTLSLVSRTWYSIILSTPSLHTYIKMDDAWGYHGDDARPPSEAFLDKTRIQLSRSHDAKLYIDIDFRYLDNMSDVRNIMKELQPHLHRAFFFRTLLPDWDWMVAVRDHSVRLGLSLEELHIHIDTADAEEQLPVTFLSVPCPRLNKVVLEHTPLTCIRPHSNVSSPPESPSSSTLTLPPPDIPLPTTLLPSLQHLHLIRDTRQGSSMRFSIPFSLLLTTLSTTPTLRTLHIQSAFFLLTGCEHIFQRQPTKLIMPQLVELTFNFVDTTNIGLFLENVDCQSLKTLKIRMDGSAGSTEDSVGFLARVCGPSPGTWAALDTIPHQPSYSRNPFSSLRHLDLRGISTTGPAIYSFIRALHSLPQLTALALSSPPSGCFGSRIWKLLGEPCVSAPSLAWEGSSSERDRQTWILPALQALVIQNARDVYGHDILRLVRARKAASAGSRGAGRGMQTIVDADDMQQTEGGDGAVAEVTYLKISGCYTLNRDGEIVNELKMFVRTVVF